MWAVAGLCVGSSKDMWAVAGIHVGSSRDRCGQLQGHVKAVAGIPVEAAAGIGVGNSWGRQ